MSEGADVDSLRQITQGFIDSGKGVDPGFENLDDQVKKSVLFPELLPKFAGSNHGDSFEYFHRNGQVGDFVWTNYPRLQFIINHMRDRIEKKGIVFKVMRNVEPIRWIVISCAAIIAFIFGLYSSDWTPSTLINNPIQTIVPIFFFAVLFVWGYYYRLVVIKWADLWEQEEDLVNKLPRSGHQRWNEEIFSLWENKLEDRIKEIIENRNGVTDQDIKDAKEIFINAVIKCDTGGNGLKVRGLLV